jgi:hypothetical protein
METPDSTGKHPTARERRWAVVRLALGQAQMIGAIVSGYLLLTTGINEWSLGGAVLTCTLTTVSVLLFGAGRTRR